MKCIVCDGSKCKIFREVEDKFIRERVRYFKCEKCGLIFLHPQPLEELKRVGLYPKQYRYRGARRELIRFTKEVFVGRFVLVSPKSIHLNFLERWGFRKKRGKVLDIGTGHGRFLYLLKMRGWEVLSVDPSPYCANIINKFLRIPTIQAGAEDFKITDEKFDLVSMISILEHLSDPVQILHKLKRVLKKNGKIYVVTIHISLNKLYATHLFQFTETTVVKLLKKMGFVTEFIKTIGGRIYLLASKS
jgi:2-polyprenyl-3-methyl-5-hydroxy-6-metoxy-1,4-benzoquinol methylase